MVEEILRWVRKGLDVCVAFYGHPGVFVTPSHEALRRARKEGFQATMLPAVSAEDCLFADLGIDPGERGSQSYEATSFLLHRPTFDRAVPLVLWQVSVVGQPGGATEPNRAGLLELAGYLERFYGPDHEVVLYVASPYPVGEPSVERIRLHDLALARVTAMSTLYVPPTGSLSWDQDTAGRLGIAADAGY